MVCPVAGWKILEKWSSSCEKNFLACRRYKKSQKKLHPDGTCNSKWTTNLWCNIQRKYQELMHAGKCKVSSYKRLHAIDIQSVSLRCQYSTNRIGVGKCFGTHFAPGWKQSAGKVPELKMSNCMVSERCIVRIDLKLDKMAQLNIPATLVSNALQSEMTNIPGGAVYER